MCQLKIVLKGLHLFTFFETNLNAFFLIEIYFALLALIIFSWKCNISYMLYILDKSILHSFVVVIALTNINYKVLHLSFTSSNTIIAIFYTYMNYLLVPSHILKITSWNATFLHFKFSCICLCWNEFHFYLSFSDEFVKKVVLCLFVCMYHNEFHVYPLSSNEFIFIHVVCMIIYLCYNEFHFIAFCF